MERYSAAITPWARATASRMVQEIAIRERGTWAQQARTMGRELRREIMNAPTGERMAQRIEEQVRDITSLPQDAAQRVFDLTVEGLSDSRRAKTYVAEIMRQGDVSKARATMLARTAVSTTASALTQARAEHVGSEGYIWRSVRDAQVRPSHREMEGKFVRWDAPPTLDGYTAHAGCYANCRCQPEPVFAEFV
ncbi:MAG: minor capsid protein [Cyanobacteria bacterium REEB65]|nr:minor capsid protein [Cyanobacteria bacterium REEB65]